MINEEFLQNLMIKIKIHFIYLFFSPDYVLLQIKISHEFRRQHQ